MRVGILTSGGDCQSLNAVMSAIVKTLYKNVKDLEIYGIYDGYEGLIYGKIKKMKEEDFEEISYKGGTILGTSRQPFKYINITEENGLNKVEEMVKNYKKWNLDALAILGGNGSHKTANLLHSKGLNIVTLPKTIDNDIWGSDISFGFHSAVNVATETIDMIRTTAYAHGRVFIIEVMGHKAGWIALYSGIAGESDVILVPEIPYNTDKVIKAVEDKLNEGKKYVIITIAEGAITQENASIPKKEFKKKYNNETGAGQLKELSQKLQTMTNKDVRITIPGHIQRGGIPVAYDRVISMQLGVKAAECIKNGNFGCMVGYNNKEVITIPLEEVAGKLKTIQPQSQIILQAKEMGICFGD